MQLLFNIFKFGLITHSLKSNCFAQANRFGWVFFQRLCNDDLPCRPRKNRELEQLRLRNDTHYRTGASFAMSVATCGWWAILAEWLVLSPQERGNLLVCWIFRCCCHSLGLQTSIFGWPLPQAFEWCDRWPSHLVGSPNACLAYWIRYTIELSVLFGTLWF